MLDCTECPLYKLQSKKLLKHLLGINNSNMLKQSYIITRVTPYIDVSNKPRLIEPPKYELKAIQKRLKRMLAKIRVPDYVFSGIKGKSYIDNVSFHIGENRNLLKIDYSSFFPSISRDLVYGFFRSDLLCSPDVATILTNFTTVDITKTQAWKKQEIVDFFSDKKIECTNHLISGAPTSQLLSYLVNHKMFDEMQLLSEKHGITMTIYVDDITFSSKNRISQQFKKQILSIIKRNHYTPSYKKTKLYSRCYPKLVTGVVINSKGEKTIKNSLRLKIIHEFSFLRANPDNKESLQRLRGLLIAARQVDKNAFPAIYHFAFKNKQL